MTGFTYPSSFMARVGATTRQHSKVAIAVVIALVLANVVGLLGITTGASADSSPCSASTNPIVCENSKPGTPDTVWDIKGYGDATIQGFATDMSVNAGSTISFKIKTDASAYSIDVYRLGYYQGNGARKVASVTPSATLPQTQPACATDTATSLYDCGTWAVSASWAVPSDAVSGVYLADLKRTDTGGMSQITFVVRNDASTSDIVYQTSDETWQAYNRYGGSDFYTGDQQNFFNSPTRARALSYNRPFITRGDFQGRDFLFSNEYPTIRFLEQNGYDLSYISGVDTDRFGATQLPRHKVFMSVGHDEYWSQQQRTNVDNARDAGVNMMFLSGNEAYWHTRFAPSIDGSNTAYRTLVCYKITWDGANTDPTGESTSTWRDPRYADAPGAAKPENALTGTMYRANSDDESLTVLKDEGKLRVWRNTGLSSMSGNSTVLAPHTIGYESDEDVDNGFRPAGLIDMSTTVASTPQYLLDFGLKTGAGTSTHHITEYRAASGALVFGAGTIQWGWGLSNEHDGSAADPDPAMQQAMINLLADMGVQPKTLMSGLVAASKSTDTTAPTATITSPAPGAAIDNGTNLTVTGTAADQGGGVVGGVEVSLDGGATWHPATGRTSWSYTGIVHGSGSLNIMARATDDSLNTQTPPSTVAVTANCPCSLLGSMVPGTTPGVGAGTTSPSVVDSQDGGAYELGVNFTPKVDGLVTGVRFYKGANNTGTHYGTLWTSDGDQLATGTFTNETASGWQTLLFSSAVRVSAGTTYVASYWDPSGHYSSQPNFFYYGAYNAYPLVAQSNTPTNTAANGVFIQAHRFPTKSNSGTNYFVDPIFIDGASAPPYASSTSPTAGASKVSTGVNPAVSFSKPVDSSTISFTLTDGSGTAVSGTTSYDSSAMKATFTPTSALQSGTQYTASVTASDTNGQPLSAPPTWSFVTAFPSGICTCTILSDAWTPTTVNANDSRAVEVGVKFSSDTAGVVNGVRFYKGGTNTASHTGELWTSSGTLLAQATFTSESSSGWQTATFSSPVSIQAGVSYVASYFSTSGYSYTSAAFSSAGLDKFPLHVATQGGVYKYGTSSTFPNGPSTSNYGVDVMFTVPKSTVPTVTSTTPSSGATGVGVSTALTATYSTSVLANSPSVTLTGPNGAVAGTTTLNNLQNVLTFTPSAALTSGSTYTFTVSGGRSLSDTPQATPMSMTFGVGSGTVTCPCNLLGAAQPTTPDSGDTAAVTLGMQFVPSTSGYITGLRYFKSAANTGTHVGALWSSSGSQLATVTFSNETSTGWQTAYFGSVVPVTAGSTYVISYFAPSGHYAYTANYFASAVSQGPLTAPAGSNGVYAYGSTSKFPSGSYKSTNYWVDPIFDTNSGDTTPPTVTAVTPGDTGTNVAATTSATATFNEAVTAGTISFKLTDAGGATVSGAVTYDTKSRTATFTPTTALNAGVKYTASVSAGDTSGNAMTSPYTWSFTVTGSCPCTLFASNATPSVVDANDPAAVNLGTKFTPAVSGTITGARFYKAAANTGTHKATLWTAGGASLASATFANETASGWQTVTFASPVTVTAGTTYVISYNAPSGHYSASTGFFSAAYTNGLLTGPSGTNGVYTYGANATFPTSSSNSTNYWVDVVFAPADTTSPATSAVSANTTSTGATVTWTTDEASTSKVVYGTSADNLNNTATAAGLVTAHSVSITGLTSGATYYYRVVSVDAAGNSATSPSASVAPATFTTGS